MKKWQPRALGGAALLLIVSATAHGLAAQDSPIPDRGARSLSFGLPDGGGTTAGAWYMLGGGNLIGFEIDYNTLSVDIDVESVQTGADTEIDNSSLLVGPTWKHYFPGSPKVAPFIRTTAAVGVTSQETLQGGTLRDTDSFMFLFRGAVGADWFATEGISIGGFTGFVLTYIDADGSVDSNTFVEQTTWTFATFKSTLVINFWF